MIRATEINVFKTSVTLLTINDMYCFWSAFSKSEYVIPKKYWANILIDTMPINDAVNVKLKESLTKLG